MIRAEAPNARGVYVASLSIENARCFQARQTLALTNRDGSIARWTLLVGENGPGKTTLLQAIAALSPAAIAATPVTQATRDSASRELFERATRWLERCSVPDSKLERRVDLELRLGLEPTRHVGEPMRVFSRDSGRGLVGSVVASVFGIPPGERIAFFAYGPHRRAGREAFSAGQPLDILGALASEAPLVNVEDWFLRSDYVATSSHNTPAERAAATRSRDRVESVVCRVLPGVKRLVPVTLDAARGETALMAETDAGRVRVGELGLGYQSTMAWVVDLAIRLMDAYTESDDPLAEPAVVLVDEIDLHLHPRWQRVLLDELTARFPRTQFIATAHSPLVVQAAPDANVVVLRRTAAGAIIDRAPESVRHWRVDQILTSDLFSLPSARPANLDPLVLRREQLLRKSKPTAADRDELRALREKLSALPGGESPALLEAEEIMLDLARERAAIEGAAGSKGKARAKARPAARRRP